LSVRFYNRGYRKWSFYSVYKQGFGKNGLLSISE
jgi:hypothetical protein